MPDMSSLYTYDGGVLTQEDFTDALRSVGVMLGDTIFVHSDVRVFGKIAEPDKTKLLRPLVEALEASVGPGGTVVMPAFSYSFCKGEPYDPDTTRSTVGVLTDFFRTESGVERSLHPMFSVSAWGKGREAFMHTSKDSFGAGTAFDTLRQADGTIVLLGTDFQACTFLHHVEQMCGVPYRFMKTFEGVVIDGATTSHESYTYFVRPLDGTIVNDFNAIEPYLREKALLREVSVGSGRILAISARRLYDEASRLLVQDPYFFVTQPKASV